MRVESRLSPHKQLYDAFLGDSTNHGVNYLHEP